MSVHCYQRNDSQEVLHEKIRGRHANCWQLRWVRGVLYSTQRQQLLLHLELSSRVSIPLSMCPTRPPLGPLLF